ncbi:unnamed protein product [Effrenium voratum]|uniref:Transmembrane protein n=1 Tax=Effrenium voratum TaxID=2562239 RepID=A0AA36MWQ6_9DINO|nr:unnamed protein product [Effrenium voratum]CAJ1383264.1 unnamed protein product [Effrenium voratum]CAJ1429183.1 unnamed protein product [Effrenium voratum]
MPQFGRSDQGTKMPSMGGRAGRDLQSCTLGVKALVVILVPIVLVRFLFLDVWGSVNDAAVPILGLFLLRGEDECFRACYERLSKIWLFNECCGVQQDVTFISALTIFALIALVSGLNDFYLLWLRDQAIMKWPGLVALNGILDLLCATVAVHMWRILHGMASFQTMRTVVTFVDDDEGQQQSSRVVSKELEIDAETLLRVSPTKRPEREPKGRGASAAIIRNLTVPMPSEESEKRRSRESSSERDLNALTREKRRSRSWLLSNVFNRSPHAHSEHRSSSQPPASHG